MGNRGFTLVEMLAALLAAAVLLLALGRLFVNSQWVAESSQSQTFLQRQGAFIMDQMTRRIRSASALSTGCNGVTSLGVTNTVYLDPDGTNRSPFCFYRSGNNHLLMDSGAGTYDLLSGSAARLTVTAFTVTLNDVTHATISFQLSDNRQNSMTFATDVARRN